MFDVEEIPFEEFLDLLSERLSRSDPHWAFVKIDEIDKSIEKLNEIRKENVEVAKQDCYYEVMNGKLHCTYHGDDCKDFHPELRRARTD